MDKQQSDHIEHRIRQAAENITPPFNEAGWQKMEVLLDKEFNKKRRRGFIWWWYGLFVFLIIGGALFYYLNTGSDTITKNNVIKKPAIVNDQNTKGRLRDDRVDNHAGTTSPKAINEQKTTPAGSLMADENSVQKDERKNALNDSNKTLSAQIPKNAVTASGKLNANRRLSGSEEIANKVIGKGRVNGRISENISSDDKAHVKDAPVQQPSNKAGNPDKNQSLSKQSNLFTDKSNPKDTSEKNTGMDAQRPANTLSHDASRADKKEATDTVSKADLAIKSDSSVTNKATVQKAIKLKTSKNIAAPGFYFMASIASDGSSVQKFSLDNREPVYGVGAGYQFNNRISLQTGFYAGRKIYTAGPTDYKAEPNSYISAYKIMKIEADCMIYELPLSFRYDIFARKNFRAYATAGLSSFIMKRENYKYHLTGNMGYVMKDSTYTNNKNFFSSAGFSIGFEQKLSRSLYIQAEPYIRVPISGVGEGKVKLYSAGLQVGIKYQPVKRNKKH